MFRAPVAHHDPPIESAKAHDGGDAAPPANARARRSASGPVFASWAQLHDSVTLGARCCHGAPALRHLSNESEHTCTLRGVRNRACRDTTQGLRILDERHKQGALRDELAEV